MWFNLQDIQQTLQNAVNRAGLDVSVVVEAEKKRNAENKVKEEGVATCEHCNEEIWFHPEMTQAGWTWESEDMLGWCGEGKGNRHQPRLIIQPEDL